MPLLARPTVLCEGKFQATTSNQKWTADITYLATGQGCLCLAKVMDLFSLRIVGWCMSASLEAKLVVEALRMAPDQRRPSAGLLHHNDRGGHDASCDFLQLLDHHGVASNMSRSGEWYDNAPTESFLAKLKAEWVHRENNATSRHNIQYIELYYSG